MDQDWRIIGWIPAGSEVAALGSMSIRSQGCVGVIRLCLESAFGVMIHLTTRAIVKSWSELSLSFEEKDGIEVSRESKKMVQTGMLSLIEFLYASTLCLDGFNEIKGSASMKVSITSSDKSDQAVYSELWTSAQIEACALRHWC